jgi:Flp pilus assembly protein TadG
MQKEIEMRFSRPEHLQGNAPRSGTVLVMFTVCLIAIMGLMALVIDGGLLRAEQIRAQAVADAAALAGARQLYQNYPASNGKDTSGSAATAALAIATDNGYANDGTNSVVLVNIPPASGQYAGLAGYVEVLITSNQNRCFSNIWSSATVAVRTRTVARGAWVPFNASIILLDTGDKGAVSVQGNGAFTSSGAPAYINSNSSSALSVSGGGSFQVSAVNITGGYNGSGITGTITTGVHPTPDPLAYLPAPGAPGAPAVPSLLPDFGRIQHCRKCHAFHGHRPNRRRLDLQRRHWQQ